MRVDLALLVGASTIAVALGGCSAESSQTASNNSASGNGASLSEKSESIDISFPAVNFTRQQLTLFACAGNPQYLMDPPAQGVSAVVCNGFISENFVHPEEVHVETSDSEKDLRSRVGQISASQIAAGVNVQGENMLFWTTADPSNPLFIKLKGAHLAITNP